MSNSKKLNFRKSVLIGLISTSTSVLADHYNQLVEFSADEISDSLEYQNCLEQDSEDSTEQLCNTQNDKQVIFDTKPILSISEQVDIRPETCESFFDDYLHTRRGLRIESALNTIPIFKNYTESVSTFPIVDFIGNGKAHVVKSKDLSAQIYSSESNPQPLYQSIIEDAEAIKERFLDVLAEKQVMTATVHGRTTTIRAGDVTTIDLHIVVQASMATPNQIEQIKFAEKELKNRWGFNLRIIEIP